MGCLLFLLLLLTQLSKVKWVMAVMHFLQPLKLIHTRRLRLILVFTLQYFVVIQSRIVAAVLIIISIILPFTLSFFLFNQLLLQQILLVKFSHLCLKCLHKVVNVCLLLHTRNPSSLLKVRNYDIVRMWLKSGKRRWCIIGCVGIFTWVAFTDL